jgi:hypothetical protein
MMLTDREARAETARSNREKHAAVERRARQLLADGLTVQQVHERLRGAGAGRGGRGVAVERLRAWAREVRS